MMSRNAFLALLFAQAVVMIPHLLRLPLWLTVGYTICVFWRIMVYRGHWGAASKVLKCVVAVATFVGVYLSFKSLWGLEPAVSLFILAFSLKLIEAKSQRDSYLLVFLCYFCAAILFLFETGFWFSVYVFIALLLISYVLLAFQLSNKQPITLSSAKPVLIIFAQSIPLMVVLFLFFPRFQPLWQVPVASHQAKTGMSDSLSPGDISQLIQETSLAFRVSFDDFVPEANQRYWRSLVLSDFDGKVWRRAKHVQYLSAEKAWLQPSDSENLFTYQVIVEPHYRHWLFALTHSSSSDRRIRASDQNTFVATLPVVDKMAYSVVSEKLSTVKTPLPLSAKALTENTRLDDASNPRARAFAKALRNEQHSSEAYMNAVLALYRQQEFYYTLEPPSLGRHTVDEFLFDTRRGFCGHYASSFVFLMRAAGIPARIVTGYLGGEINPLTKALLVYQYDAHAWAEVWLADKGWVRVDPTAEVAPNRVEQTARDLFANDPGFSENNPVYSQQYRQFAWLSRLRLRLDAVDYYWATWVLQYRDQQQLDVIRQLLGEVSAWRLLLVFFCTAFLVVLLVMARVWLKQLRKKQTKALRIYFKFCRAIERLGVKRQPDEGIIDFYKRVAHSGQLSDESLQVFKRASSMVSLLSYASLSAEQKKRLLFTLNKLQRSFNP